MGFTLMIFVTNPVSTHGHIAMRSPTGARVLENIQTGDSEYHAWIRTTTLDRSHHPTEIFSRLPPDIFQQYVELSQLPRRYDEDCNSHRYYQTIKSAIKIR